MSILTIEELKETIELFSPVQCDFLSENCIVVLENNNHKTGCNLKVTGNTDVDFKLNWTKKINKSGYKEEKKITEHGAEAISFFLTKNLTEYSVVEEARIGTGVDYWLGHNSDSEKYDPKNFFNARLEISGIYKETPTNSLEKRVKEKKEQTKPTDHLLIPAYISVVEFSTPKAYFAKK